MTTGRIASAAALTMAMMVMAGVPLTGAAMAAAPSSRLAMGLDAGEWELRDRSEDGASRRLCVAHLGQLLQSRHAGHSCKSFTVSDTPKRRVVTYDCGAAGNGRTDLRVETPRLVQLQSQGIAHGAPFESALEGRWVGACRQAR